MLPPCGESDGSKRPYLRSPRVNDRAAPIGLGFLLRHVIRVRQWARILQAATSESFETSTSLGRLCRASSPCPDMTLPAIAVEERTHKRTVFDALGPGTGSVIPAHVRDGRCQRSSRPNTRVLPSQMSPQSLCLPSSAEGRKQ